MYGDFYFFLFVLDFHVSLNLRPMYTLSVNSYMSDTMLLSQFNILS
jgi:hypothetical protein